LPCKYEALSGYTFTRSTVKSSTREVAHLYPKVERRYELLDFGVLFEDNVPDELVVLGGRRVVAGVVGDVDTFALERYRHEVRRADDQRNEVDEHYRQLGATDAAPDGAVTRVTNEQVPAATQPHLRSALYANSPN